MKVRDYDKKSGSTEIFTSDRRLLHGAVLASHKSASDDSDKQQGSASVAPEVETNEEVDESKSEGTSVPQNLS